MWEVLQKQCFRRSRHSDDLSFVFLCFSGALAAAFLTFAALETGLKIDEFSGWPRFKVRQVEGQIKDRLGTLKAMKKLLADLQKATSGLMSV